MTDQANEFQLRVKHLGREIEQLKLLESNLSYIECTVEVCLRNDLEFEGLKKSIPKNIREKIEYEATQLNLINRKQKVNSLMMS